jgi:hypothetical protein
MPPPPPGVQVPAVHDSPSKHTFPHMPQLAVLVIVFTQAPPHSTSGAAQPHEPEVHAVPPMQAFPQKPQLVGSDASMEQAPLQFSSPAAQLALQAPCEHTWP